MGLRTLLRTLQLWSSFFHHICACTIAVVAGITGCPYMYLTPQAHSQPFNIKAHSQCFDIRPLHFQYFNIEAIPHLSMPGTFPISRPFPAFQCYTIPIPSNFSVSISGPFPTFSTRYFNTMPGFQCLATYMNACSWVPQVPLGFLSSLSYFTPLKVEPCDLLEVGGVVSKVTVIVAMVPILAS